MAQGLHEHGAAAGKLHACDGASFLLAPGAGLAAAEAGGGEAEVRCGSVGEGLEGAEGGELRGGRGGGVGGTGVGVSGAGGESAGGVGMHVG